MKVQKIGFVAIPVTDVRCVGANRITSLPVTVVQELRATRS